MSEHRVLERNPDAASRTPRRYAPANTLLIASACHVCTLPEPVWRAPGLTAVEIRAKHSYACPPEDPCEGDIVLDFFSRGETIGLNGISN